MWEISLQFRKYRGIIKKSVFQGSGKRFVPGVEKRFVFSAILRKMEETTMIQLVKLPVQKGNAPLRIAKGHFVTNHSHINYYIDITRK